METNAEMAIQNKPSIIPPANDFWLNKIKSDGVRLMAEIDLTYDEFKRMHERSVGCELSDDEIYATWEVIDRRLLPADAGSFSGVGFEIGECVRRDIEQN